MSIDLQPGYVLIIPRDAADQHELTAALYAALQEGEGIGQTTATPVLSFIVPQSLADRIGRGADQSLLPPSGWDPDAPEQSGLTLPDSDETAEDDSAEQSGPDGETAESDAADESASSGDSAESESGSGRRRSARSRSRAADAQESATETPAGEPGQASDSQEG